jgi:Pyridoxamine 5'-phosphate oxidase
MPVTTADVWKAIDDGIFGVLSFVNAEGEPRSAGVCYVVDDRSLLITSDRNAWKVRHIAADPHVSMTITLPKHVPFMPFIKVPAATITFHGEAEILEVTDVDGMAVKRLFRGLEFDRDVMEETAIIRVVPRGEFVTYGVAMPMMRMRKPSEAKGRTACGTERTLLHAA